MDTYRIRRKLADLAPTVDYENRDILQHAAEAVASGRKEYYEVAQEILDLEAKMKRNNAGDQLEEIIDALTPRRATTYDKAVFFRELNRRRFSR